MYKRQGQYHDLVNPCALMVWMGGVANGGKAAVPELVLKTEGGFPHLSLHFPHRTSQQMCIRDRCSAG